MRTEIYNSSKGPRPIADMPFKHLCNAIEVVALHVRLGADERRDELSAMIERRDAMNAAYREAQAQSEGVGI